MTKTLMVALRWDGRHLSGRELMAKASAVVQKIDARFAHLPLDIQAMPADEAGQFVQLVVRTDCSDSEAVQIRDALKREFVSA